MKRLSSSAGYCNTNNHDETTITTVDDRPGENFIRRYR